MKIFSRASTVFMICMALFISGCQESRESVPSEDCFVETYGNREFLGTAECVAEFQTESIVGYWVVEFEYSLFYPSEEALVRGSRDRAFALSFLKEPSGRIRDLMLAPERRVFQVSFDGSKSEIPGIYGEEMPELSGGVVVKENFVIEDELQASPKIN